jgi:PiT family inorganic phosphate transporter
MESQLSIMVFGVLAGAYMAWNIGANDVANSMASAVGAKAITLRQALFIATILTFIGACFVGSHVAQTIRKGIIYSQMIGDTRAILLGLLAALLSASLWVCLATLKSLPVSTTHSIVGAMIGVGLVAGGLRAVNWYQVITILVSWILSPVLSALSAYVLFRMIDRFILSRMETVAGAIKTSPFLVALTIFVMSLSLFLNTPFGRRFGVDGLNAVLVPLVIGTFFYCLASLILRIAASKGRFSRADEIFRYLQVVTSCYVAFGNGANDVANAMGPLAGMYFIIVHGTVAETAPVPTGMLAFGGVMICIGICTWGYRVIETVGFKITQLSNTRGFAVDFSAATVILISSMMGLPVSTTHAVIGAYVGVGLAGGLQALDVSVLWKIMVYWMITVPVAAVTAALIFLVLNIIF